MDLLALKMICLHHENLLMGFEHSRLVSWVILMEMTVLMELMVPGLLHLILTLCGSSFLFLGFVELRIWSKTQIGFVGFLGFGGLICGFN